MEQEPHWILLNKQSEQKIYVKKSRMNVGRCAAADIICYSDNISRNQAYITVDADGDLYVHDNQSVNGTFINCQRIDPKKLYKLKMNDEVSFGLHSQVPFGEGQKYIFEVIDLRIKKENSTEEKTTKDLEIRQPVVLLTNMNVEAPDMDEKLLDIPIKLEPLDVSKINDLAPKTPKGYTIEDSVIVVDDSDESDSEGPFSQLLSEWNTNKSKVESGIGDNTFFEVKKELEEMEQGADGCVVSIDDDFDHSPVSSHDLLLMLEDSFEKGNRDKKVEPQETSTTERSNHVALNGRRVSLEDKTTQKQKDEASAKKYVIPPIISPHFEIPKSRKRKSVIEVSATKSKRSKSTEAAQPKPKLTPRKEGLRNKLKVVAMKEKSTAVQEKQSIPPAPAKVKVSESRGNFLIKPVEVTPNLAKKTVPGKPTAALPNRIPFTFKSTPSTSAASTSSYGNIGDAITMSNGNFKMSKTHEMLEDILLQVLSWNPTWFNERISNDTLPPINKKPLLKLLNSFTNYAEYYNIVLPHWLVELWYFFCKEFDSHPDRLTKSFKAHLEKCTNNGKFIELKCYGYISKEENDQLSHIREEDLVLLDVTFANNKKLRGAYLGSVCNVKKSFVRSNSNHREVKLLNGMVPYAILDFNVLMKTSREIRSFKKIVEVRFFTNMMSTWRIFKSIKHLKYSPLCSHILNPNLQNHRHPSDNMNLNALKLDTKLNYNQKCAVAESTKLCLGSEPGICMIQGPPGTGKSTVIVNIVKQIILTRSPEASQQCILLVAPTNTAIDDLMVKLMDFKSKIEGEDRKKFKIIRFGPPASIGSMTKSYSLNEIAKNNLFKTCFQKFSNNTELTEMQNKISVLKSQLGQSSRVEAELTVQRSLLEKKCIELMGRSELNQIEQRLLAGANIICTTLSSCLGTRMEEVFTTNSNKISCCIVDESTNSKEQETFIPLKLGISKLVLIGDPKQLPGVTFAKEAKEYGHGNSLFARLMANFAEARKNPVRFLNIQYRMNPAICSFPNHTYYNGLLKTDPNVLKRKNPICTALCPYLVFQMENDLTNINQQQEYQNDSETNFILKLVQAIVEILPLQHKINIGIITPYNIQKDSIHVMVQRHKFGPNLSISINTVDSFQGQEKDIVILSSVRTFSNNFLADNQRLNVALTRAKYALYVIGTENLFKTCEIFGKLQRNSKNRKLLRYVPSAIDVPHLKKYIKQTRPDK